MKIVLFVSVYRDEEIHTLIRNVRKDTTYLFVFSDERQYEVFRNLTLPSQIRVLSQKEITNHSRVCLQPTIRDFQTVCHSILGDHQSLMYSDRTSFFRPYGLGVNHFIRYLLKLTACYLHFYRTEKPDFVYFKSMPHQAEAWVKAKVAEYLGIDILHSEITAIPWRVSLMKGLEKEREYCIPDFSVINQDDDDAMEHEFLEDYIRRLQSGYDQAIPHYEKAPLKKNKGKYLNLRRELVRWWKRPDLIVNKYKCFNHYSKLSGNPDPGSKSIVYFLHYQPERTTLPEGFGFAQQLLAIQELRIAAPEDITIYVKEHPSTFTQLCDPTQRHPSFYDDIQAMEGVELINMDVDPFTLVDMAGLTATISGTVGVESLLRGKPVIYFGRTSIEDHFGVHRYTDNVQLSEFIREAFNGFSSEKIIQEVRKHLLNSMNYSVSTRTKMDDLDYERLIDEAKFKILTHLVGGAFRIVETDLVNQAGSDPLP
jgi:hypothetical protein